MEIVNVEADAAAEVAALALALTREIMQRTGARHFEVELAGLTTLCQRLLAEGRYSVLAVRETDRLVAFAALCESHALYVGGAFGIVQEFYVLPAHRSRGLGARLLGAAVDTARARGWARLELCTPPLPEFERTVAFYAAHGFEVTGGRKMKHALG